MHLKDSLLIFFLAQIHNRGSKSENQTIRRYGIVFRIVFLLKRIRRSDEIECSESSSFRPAYRLSLKLLFPILHSPLGATEPQRNKGQRRDRGIPFEGVRSRSRSPEESFGRIQTEYLLKKNQTKARKLPNRWGMKSRPFRLRKRPKVKGERTKESGPVCLEWERSRVWAEPAYPARCRGERLTYGMSTAMKPKPRGWRFLPYLSECFRNQLCQLTPRYGSAFFPYRSVGQFHRAFQLTRLNN